MNSWMNLIKETFINGKEGHHIYHQWFGMPYIIYVICNSKRTGFYLKKSPMLSLSRLNNIQQGGVDVLKD